MKEYHFDNIDSTQNYAKDLCFKPEKDFFVFADIQSSGRGRSGRIWESPIGGLWFSFDMDIPRSNDLFTMTIGIAVREVLKEIYKEELQLKWPNDILLNRKKVAGIICERVQDRIIVGIGVNTNIKSINNSTADTFFNVTGITVDNYSVMKDIIERCKKTIKLTKDEIVEIFRSNMAYKGEECYISVLKENAKIIDISCDGNLIVEINNKIKEVAFGEINLCI